MLKKKLRGKSKFKASLLYDMGRYREAETVLKQIPSINPTFDAMCESLRFKLLEVR